MKKWKWRIAAFVAWVVTTLIVVSVSLRGVSKADTATNLVSVAILLFWTLLSFATNCFTFKNNKNNEKIKNQLDAMGYDYAVAIATKAEIENGAACGQLAIICE